MLILINGSIASGKSTIARAYAHHLAARGIGAAVIDRTVAPPFSSQSQEEMGDPDVKAIDLDAILRHVRPHGDRTRNQRKAVRGVQPRLAGLEPGREEP